MVLCSCYIGLMPFQFLRRCQHVRTETQQPTSGYRAYALSSPPRMKTHSVISPEPEPGPFDPPLLVELLLLGPNCCGKGSRRWPSDTVDLAVLLPVVDAKPYRGGSAAASAARVAASSLVSSQQLRVVFASSSSGSDVEQPPNRDDLPLVGRFEDKQVAPKGLGIVIADEEGAESDLFKASCAAAEQSSADGSRRPPPVIALTVLLEVSALDETCNGCF